MAGVTGIGWSNQFKVGTIVAGSSEAALGPGNLSSDQCSPGWQTASGVITAAAGATLRCTASSTGAVWRMVGLFRTNLMPSATVTFTLWSGATAVFARTVSGPSVGYAQVPCVMDRDYTGDYVTIAINDPTNTDGFINIGGAFGGPAWFPAAGITWDSAYNTNVTQETAVSRGGNEFVTLLYRQRVWKLALDTIRDSEAGPSLGELVRISALGTNIMFVPDMLSLDLFREVIFGRLISISDVTFPRQLTDARSWRGQVTERL